MAYPSYTYTLANSTTADATQVMQDFNDILNGVKDGTKDHNINALTCAGATVLNGTVTLGDSSADDITWTGSLASSIAIKATNTYDIGASALAIRSIYFASSDSAAFGARLIGGIVASNKTLTLPTSTGTLALTTDIPTSPSEAFNVGFTSAASASTLIGALKQSDGSTDPSTGTAAVKVTMRNVTATTGSYTERSVTAALSLTLGVYTTLGSTSAVAGYVYWYLIDSDGAGTMKVGASSTRYDDGTLVTTLKESDTFTVTIATPGVFTMAGNTLANGDSVILTTSSALPTGLSVNTIYYVVNNATDGAGKFRLSATAAGTDINTSGTQSGTHTLHVADGRMASDGYYSSKAARCIARSTATQTTGNWASATEVSLFPINSGRQAFVGLQQGTNGTANTASFANLTNRVVNTFVPGTTGKYKISCTGPAEGDTANREYYLKLNATSGSPVNLSEQQSVIRNDASVTQWFTFTVWRLDWLTAGTPYVYDLQGAVQTATNILTVGAGATGAGGCRIIAEQVE